MHTEPLDELYAHVQMSEVDLTKAQLKAAIARKDEQRKIQLSIRMKEIFYKDHAREFVLSQCNQIKTTGEFARGKILKKDKIKANMLVWSKVRTSSLSLW